MHVEMMCIPVSAQPWTGKKVPSALAEGTIFKKVNYLQASSTATATETVMPTMGLLPAPEARRKQASVEGFSPEKFSILL